jgi:hypothetical protein
MNVMYLLYDIIFRMKGEAAAAEELDYETFLTQEWFKDQLEFDDFKRHPMRKALTLYWRSKGSLFFC